ncbi:hypothetical protein [Mucilaginibacter panaciglaebae]|uniref:MORN repeat protein n=1 Tax=Mucilaginibacter panaciglaebae TaxID=502331 RepID=A0ABP7X0J5_9SPHI
MKITFIILTAGLFCSTLAKAQDTTPQHPVRSIHYQFIDKDSVKLALNEDFELIEDSCASIFRYARLDTAFGKFSGHIRDVNKADPNVVRTEGTYDKDGNKEGLFVSHFANGQLESKGSFVKNKFDGKWELYYDNGKPRMNFEAHGHDVQLTDYWDPTGKKIVDNGSGKYRFNVDQIYWEGHLMDGRPVGSWYAYRSGKDEPPIMTEMYKLGEFQVGRSPSGKEYKDSARMELVSLDLLPFTRAEALRTSAIPCGVIASNIVHPQYKDGMDIYNNLLSEEVAQALKTTDLKPFKNNSFSVNGIVDDKGKLANLEAVDSFDPAITRSLITALKRMPALEPVMVNGRRVKVKVQVNFIFNGGFCRFNYAFSTAGN